MQRENSDNKENPKLTVHVTNGDSSLKNQKLLLYTDRMANLQSVSKGGQKCEERAELSQKICVDGGKLVTTTAIHLVLAQQRCQSKSRKREIANGL